MSAESSSLLGSAPEPIVGMVAWSTTITDHHDLPVGGLVVDVAVTEAGERAVVVIDPMPGRTPPYRVRTMPLTDVAQPLDRLVSVQLLGRLRMLAGFIRDRGKNMDSREDRQLWEWMGGLLDRIEGGV